MPDELNEKQIENLKQIKKDYLDTFSSNHGKRVLANLDKICFTNKTTYSEQPGRIELNEGMRFVVVHIKNMMLMNIETLTKLTREGA